MRLFSAVLAIVCALALISPATAATSATAPHDSVGYWNHVCIAFRVGTVESITFGSDGRWADAACQWWVSHVRSAQDPWRTARCEYGRTCTGGARRLGRILDATILRYTGEWKTVTDVLTHIGTGSAWIAMRDTSYHDYTEVDASWWIFLTLHWNQQNGFYVPPMDAGGVCTTTRCQRANRVTERLRYQDVPEPPRVLHRR